MDPNTQISMLMSVMTVAIAIHVLAKHRPGRFMLVRVEDAERHRAGTRRVLICNAVLAIAAVATIIGSHNPKAPALIIAVIGAALVPPLWILVGLRLALRGVAPSPIPSRFRVSLEPPRSFLTYLSPPLQLLNVAALIAPVLALCVWNAGEMGLWFFFLPMMLFVTVLVSFCAWMQARERWVLPASGEERYIELQYEKRTRTVRLLESALACWNLGLGLIWFCLAVDTTGPGYIGAIVALTLGGPVFLVATAVQLPQLTRIADELAALAETEALGTRQEGWRWGGLVYYAPDDPALSVPKRSGIGHTLNFARPAAWLFLTAVFLVPPLITMLALVGARG